MTGGIEPRRDLHPGSTNGGSVSVNYEVHEFICRYGALLFLSGLLAWAVGESSDPLTGGIRAVLVLAGLANRVRRGTKQR
jgi:hypothetical protein